MIRAKFRCMKTTLTWDGHSGADFLPVYQKKPDGQSANFEENRIFWEATPSGEASLTFNGPHEFEPGSYYYIDMIEAEKGPWTFQELRSYGPESYNAGDILLNSGWNYEPGLQHGEVKMTIKFAKTLEMFGKPGGKWDVKFSLAGPSD